jgi:hypothetical protein
VPTIEKTVHVAGQKVDDLWGLYLELRKADFQVKNVGADDRGTYVYLELNEDKDPSPIVESWIGKPAPIPSPLLKNVRVKELEKVEAEEAVRVQQRLEEQRKFEEARAKAEAEGIPLPIPQDPPAMIDAGPEKIGFLKKVFRKFF